MPDYDTTPFIHAETRDEFAANCLTCTDDYGDVCCVVTWTPNGGEPVTATGPHLDGDRRSGEIVLSCGVFAVLDGLDMDADAEKRELICDLVNRQLRQRPWAVLICPDGTAKVELLPHG